MLKTDRFKERSAGAALFLKLIKFLVEKENGQMGSDAPKEVRRITSFLDTDALALHRRGFALRLREEISPEPGFRVDLKYRDPDRYRSAEQHLGTKEHKFEEDILFPFISKFSKSATVESAVKPNLALVKQAAELFPGLEKLGLDENSPLVTVNDFRAAELVLKPNKIKFGDQKVEASLNFWYFNDSESEYPLIAEFSFGYKAAGDQPADKLEIFPRELVEGAGKIFSALQKQAGWLDTSGTTKTAFAIDG